MDIGKFIGWLIAVGLILATFGTLGEVTAALRDQAVRDCRHGMIHLRTLNERLQQGR